MSGNVQTLIDVDRGTMSKIIDDSVYQQECAQLRRELGTGFIRDKKGTALAKLTLSIPMDEFMALVMAGDQDAESWWRDPNDRRAMRRLVARYPHWKCTEGGL